MIEVIVSGSVRHLSEYDTGEIPQPDSGPFTPPTDNGEQMSNLKLNIPNDVIKIHKAFKKNGKKLYVVGGAIRDAILGKSHKDFDLATDAKPEEVEKIAKDNGI